MENPTFNESKRLCSECGKTLSIYNKGDICFHHNNPPDALMIEESLTSFLPQTKIPGSVNIGPRGSRIRRVGPDLNNPKDL